MQDLQEQSAAEGGWVAIVEVCGFNDWLLELLAEYGCRQIVLIQPDKTSKKKTDRRDAQQLCELLWVNRHRLHDARIPGVRRVLIPPQEAMANRRLTTVRQRAAAQRSRVLCRIKHLLRRQNLSWDCPTKTLGTCKARQWLQQLPLHAIDRLEMNQLLVQWRQWDQYILKLERCIIERVIQDADAQLLMSVPGIGPYTALAFSCRINAIARFPRPRSLANYWGLTPSSRNSGEATQRLGSITKQGSAQARFLLGQLVLHVLRRDRRMREWYKAIRRRRGAKIARVAVMRRLANIFWHMLTHRQPYGGDARQVDPAASQQDWQRDWQVWQRHEKLLAQSTSHEKQTTQDE
jgi:transposase